MSSEPSFIVRHVASGLFIQERAGSMARWSKDRERALQMTMDEWELSLNPQADRTALAFDEAQHVAQAADPFGWYNEEA